MTLKRKFAASDVKRITTFQLWKGTSSHTHAVQLHSSNGHQTITKITLCQVVLVSYVLLWGTMSYHWGIMRYSGYLAYPSYLWYSGYLAYPSLSWYSGYFSLSSQVTYEVKLACVHAIRYPKIGNFSWSHIWHHIKSTTMFFLGGGVVVGCKVI